MLNFKPHLMKSTPQKVTAICNCSLLLFHPSCELFEISIQIRCCVYISSLVFNEVLLKNAKFLHPVVYRGCILYREAAHTE
jgi:hypothetical protein